MGLPVGQVSAQGGLHHSLCYTGRRQVQMSDVTDRIWKAMLRKQINWSLLACEPGSELDMCNLEDSGVVGDRKKKV